MLNNQQKKKLNETITASLKIRGYLFKKSTSFFSHYQKRFFIVIDNQLAYFTDESLDQAKKKMNFNEIKDIKAIGEIEFTFGYKKKQYLFKTSSNQEKEQWIASLKNLVQHIDQINEIRLLELKETKESYPQNKFVLNIKEIFGLLGLVSLQKQYDQDYIKNRVIGHCCSKGYLFLLSVKSLSDKTKDEIILNKQLINPYDFNILYLYEEKQKSLTKLLCSQDISQIVPTARTLRINTVFFNLSEQQPAFTSEFIMKLRKSIQIGKQYRNKLGIPLKQNIDSLVQFFTTQNHLHKQHMQIKLQDQYIDIISSFKGYKTVYQKFQQLIIHIIFHLQNILGAVKIKRINLQQLEVLYVTFYSQKTHRLMKNYWNENHQKMSIQQIISMSSLSNTFYYTINKYIKHQHNNNMLRDIYIKKILCDIEDTIQAFLKQQNNFFTIQNYEGTIIPFSFMKIIKSKFQMIQKYTISKQSILQSEKLLIQASTLILIQGLQTKLQLKNYNKNMLISLSHDIWRYCDLMKQYFGEIDLNDVKNYLMKFHKWVMKKLVQICLGEDQQCIKISHVQFLSFNIKQYFDTVDNVLTKIKNFNYRSKNQLQQRKVQLLIAVYYKNLLNSIGSNNDIKKIVNKIQSELGNTSQHSEKIGLFIKCLLHLIKEQFTQESIKQKYTLLKHQICLEQFKISDIKILIKLRQNPVDLGFLMNMYNLIRNQNPEQQMGYEKTKPQRETKSEAEILVRSDICFEGYIKRKKIQINSSSGGYVTEYFKLNSECLFWYDNSCSDTLLGTILLSDIKQVYPHTNSPQKFFIDSKTGTRHKFKASSMNISLKWVQYLNSSLLQSKQSLSSTKSVSSIFQQQIFINYFEQQSSIQKDRLSNITCYLNLGSSKTTDTCSSKYSKHKSQLGYKNKNRW